jgi:hypothetical protein
MWPRPTQPSQGPRLTLPIGFGPWLIVALAAALRLPLLFVTPGVDYPFYLSLGRLSDLGFLPYRDYWLEYPPVFPWLAVLAYRFVLLFPPHSVTSGKWTLSRRRSTSPSGR